MFLFFFDNYTKSQELEGWPMRPHRFPHEQFEGAFRRLKLVAFAFTPLQGVDQFLQLSVALAQFDSIGLNLFLQPTPTRSVRYQHTLAVADQPWDDMFIGRRILEHRMDMDSPLVGERRISNIRLVFIGHEVRDFGYKSRNPLEMTQPFS